MNIFFLICSPHKFAYIKSKILIKIEYNNYYASLLYYIFFLMCECEHRFKSHWYSIYYYIMKWMKQYWFNDKINFVQSKDETT